MKRTYQTTNEMIELIKLSIYKPTQEKVIQVLNQYIEFGELYVYEDDCLLGIMGVKNNEVGHLAVKETYQNQGIGRKMLESYHGPLTLETDDDAVGFYLKSGFELVESFYKHETKRYLLKRG
jgi:GNAT superfamily N-acetyltransferase